MKAATVHEIKKELESLEADHSKALCLRLARFKKENKELLTYLLFEAQDEQAYINSVKDDVELEFSEINKSNLYYVKKTMRKILRMVNKQIRYSGIPATELALRIHFCQQIKKSGIAIGKSQVLINLYQQQMKKIQQALGKLEEDLQFDYQSDIKSLTR